MQNNLVCVSALIGVPIISAAILSFLYKRWKNKRRQYIIPSIKERPIRILICATGSVATIKVPEIIHMFGTKDSDLFDIRVCFTNSALHFCPLDSLESSISEISKQKTNGKEVKYKVYTDKDEWIAWQKRGDPVTHVELKKWADILLMSPLDANTLAKLVSGQCDNLVTCICRAWEIPKPFVMCPAMNTSMWTHPFTKKHLDILERELGAVVIQPISKVLMCGDSGTGAMATLDDIYNGVIRILGVN